MNIFPMLLLMKECAWQWHCANVLTFESLQGNTILYRERLLQLEHIHSDFETKLLTKRVEWLVFNIVFVILLLYLMTNIVNCYLTGENPVS